MVTSKLSVSPCTSTGSITVCTVFICGSSDEGGYRYRRVSDNRGRGFNFCGGLVSRCSPLIFIFLIGFFPAARSSSQECRFWTYPKNNKDKNSRFGSEPVVQAENKKSKGEHLDTNPPQKVYPPPSIVRER